MAILNLVALAFLTVEGVSAGPCRVSSSAAITSVDTEVTTTISTNNEVTETATKSFTTIESMETPIESEIYTDEPTSTIETFATQITTTTEIDDTAFVTTTTEEDIATSITTTASAITTVGAPVLGCDSLPSPYVASNGDRYEIKCNWKYTGWQAIGSETRDTTFEECIKACSSEPACAFAQFDVAVGNVCYMIEVGFDYDGDAPGASVAVKMKPS